MTVMDLHWTHHLPPVSLNDLNAQAARMTRVDRKYLVPVTALEELVAETPDARVLVVDDASATTYTSTYLDTPELHTYHLAGRRRRRRWKVRTRRYAGGATFLEVKWRDGRGRTHKRRQPSDGPWPLHHTDQAFIMDSLATAGIRAEDPARLIPTLVTSYQRTTLLLPTDAARVTIDLDLTCRSGLGQATFGHVAVIETKAGHRLTEFDRLLHRNGHRETHMSKYGVGLASTIPGLPAEKWHRTLTQLTKQDLA